MQLSSTGENEMDKLLESMLLPRIMKATFDECRLAGERLSKVGKMGKPDDKVSAEAWVKVLEVLKWLDQRAAEREAGRRVPPSAPQ
jgi:hypothetical protein